MGEVGGIVLMCLGLRRWFTPTVLTITRGSESKKVEPIPGVDNILF